MGGRRDGQSIVEDEVRLEAGLSYAQRVERAAIRGLFFQLRCALGRRRQLTQRPHESLGIVDLEHHLPGRLRQDRTVEGERHFAAERLDQIGAHVDAGPGLEPGQFGPQVGVG